MRRHAAQEQRNQLDVRHWLAHQFRGRPPLRPLDAMLLCEINARLLRGIDSVAGHAGKFRGQRVAIRGGLPQTRHPPAPNVVPQLTETHLGWFATRRARQISPVARATLVCAGLCAIHPFTEGNGRTARLASTAVLLTAGFSFRGEATLEEFFETERQRYMQGVMWAILGDPECLAYLYHEAVTVLMTRSPRG